MAKSPLKAFLRTPRGQLTLFAVTLAGAAVIALGIALNRTWFEQYVREKYPEPPAAAAELAPQLEAGSAGTDAIQALKTPERSGLYDYWMRRDDLPESSRLPRLCVEADPHHFAARVERTLIAGSPEQRTRALAFARQALRAGPVPELTRVLEWAEARAERMRQKALKDELRAALEAVAQPSSAS